MIFGRKKKTDTQTPQATVPVATENPASPTVSAPVPPQPAAEPAPAPTVAPTAPVAQSAPPPSAPAAQPPVAPAPEAVLVPETPDERPSRAQRAMASKMIAASFGEIISILMRSNTYRHFSLSDLEWLAIPPVMTQQFVLAEARKEKQDIGVPVAVALWASVSEEVDKKLTANTTGPLRLRPDEWRSGDILWLIDAVGPNQVLDGLVASLHKNVFKGRPVKVRGRDKQGKLVINIQKMPVADDTETA